jgi:type IV secretory pathway VirB10-like protein
MKERVPRTLDGLVSAARRDGPMLSTLSRVADEVVQSASSVPSGPRSLLRGMPLPRVAIVAVAASAVAFGVVATTQVVEDRRPSVVTPQQSEAPVQPEPPATTPSATAPAATHAVENAPEIPTIDVRSLPDPKMPPEQRTVARDTAKTTALEEASEGALLHRAHAVIATDPRQALALTVEHSRRFPNGMLAQEREVIAIEALARLGRAGDARARAAAFFATYPGSAYRRRVDDALGASAANAPSSAGTP